MRYFTCEVRLDDDYETPVQEVYLLHLPRIGEHIAMDIDSRFCKFRVEDIWHFCGGDKVGHRVIIYVKEINEII